MVYKFFDKKSEGSSVNIEVKHTEQLAKQLTVHSGFKENIWGADLADVQLISKFNKGFRFLLCY